MPKNSRLPSPIIRFSSGQTSLSMLVTGNTYSKKDYPWANRFVGKFPLPSWQRPLVWTLEQQIEFIESVYMGYDLGSIMINDYKIVKGNMLPMSDILIDGQQRVFTCVNYVNNGFPVNGLYWKDLERHEQRKFMETNIGKKSVSCFDEEKLKQVYDHLNFSGTKHQNNERALSSKKTTIEE